MATTDRTDSLSERIAAAAEAGTPLTIRGGDSKAFYGRAPTGDPLDIGGHSGIVNYEPTELVLTARGGTPLHVVEAALQEGGQMMPFEPPDHGGTATLGGAIAAGLSGPRRPWAGAARDMVLGTRLMNGHGTPMRLGGEVMKNVAGYDVSRLVTGAMGTLGILLEVSMKVLPAPESEQTRVLEYSPDEGFAAVERWYREGLPITGAAHDGEHLRIRLAGAASAVRSGAERTGGSPLDDGPGFWRGLRDQTLPFFREGETPLWRVSLPPAAPALDLPGSVFHDWGGQLRWLRSDAPAEQVFSRAAELGGHATLFRGGDRFGPVFQPLGEGLMTLHRRLKAAFDPAGILNPGRLYPDI